MGVCFSARMSGDQSLSGLLSSCSSGLLAFQTAFAGQGQGQLTGSHHGQSPGPSPGQSALEGFQRLDSSAQIALLQRLTAAKADTPDSKWAQGTGVSTSVKPSGSLSRAPAVTTSSAAGLTVPARQFGTGLVASMLATGMDHNPNPIPQLHPPLSPSQPSSIIPRSALGKASVLSHSGMLRHHSGANQPIMPASASQQRRTPFMDMQRSAPGQLQGIAQQGIFHQGLSQQASHMSSGLLSQQPGSLPGALSGISSFTSVPSSQLSVPQPGMSSPWQHQTQVQTMGMMQLPCMLSQSHMPAPSGFRGVTAQSAAQLQPSILRANSPFLQHKETQNLESPQASVKCESGVGKRGSSVTDTIGLETPRDVESGSGQGSAAMEFDASDHGLASLDFLGDLDHSGALDLDPEDCMF